MAYDVVIKNALIPQGNETEKANILINDGKIAGYVSDLGGVEFEKSIDAEGNLTLPGCIDSHVHFNDPGFTHRENFITGSSAAASGGITTVIDMPCTSQPSVRSVDSLEEKLEAIKDRSYIDYGMWGGVTGEDVREGWLDSVRKQAEYGVCAFKVYMTPSVPTYPRVRDPEMLEAFKAVAETGLPVGVHAENFDMADFYTSKYEEEGRTDGPAWAEARDWLVEKVAIQLTISFAEFTGADLHIVHMSSKAGAELIKDAKERGVSVSAETCPHYLTLNYQEAMTEFMQFAKIAPPLRSKEDNEAHWEALRNGVIDFVGTDHAPYEIETEKAADGMHLWNSFPGIPGVETNVPILISEGYNKGRLPLSRLVEVLSEKPAKKYGLYPRKGSMNIGADADFTIVDLDYQWSIDQNQVYTMAKYTPFHGFNLTGKPVKTVVRGEQVYDVNDGMVGDESHGEFLRRTK